MGGGFSVQSERSLTGRLSVVVGGCRTGRPRIRRKDAMARRYVSIKEVAARAGVSFQTASKVLNGGDVRVSVETEERIMAAAAELGYRPNTIARSLVQRTTATIGLVAS